MAWLIFFHLVMSSFALKDGTPENFPSSIEIIKVPFENWSKEIRINSVWTTYPKTSDQVLQVSNWAVQNNYKLRPSGNRYSWSSLTLNPANPTDRTVVISTKYLNRMSMAQTDESGLPSVTVETGATMDKLLTFLQSKGFALASVPVLGDVTVGGVLATGSHGTGIPTANNQSHGLSFGSLSNAITELSAIVWNEGGGNFELKTFHRSQKEINCLLTSLGRIFVTEVTIRVGQNQRLRCISRMDLHIGKLFAKPIDGQEEFTENSLAAFANQTGVVGSIFFPFTTNPWVKIWTNEKTKPVTSREVTKPYNYPFTENMPECLVNLLVKMQSGNSAFTPFLANSFAFTIRGGHRLASSGDIWGWTRNINLSTKNSTLRVLVHGFAVLTSRAQLQRVLYEAFEIYNRNVNEFARQQKYPINAPIEIRIGPVDNPNDVQVKGAMPPSFSLGTSVEGRPDFDTCVWLDIATFSKTEFVPQFIEKVEGEFVHKFNGDYAIVRQEWSKKSAFTESGPWTNKEIIKNIPKLYPQWADAVDMFKKMDPHGIFQNSLVKDILS